MKTLNLMTDELAKYFKYDEHRNIYRQIMGVIEEDVELRDHFFLRGGILGLIKCRFEAGTESKKEFRTEIFHYPISPKVPIADSKVEPVQEADDDGTRDLALLQDYLFKEIDICAPRPASNLLMSSKQESVYEGSKHRFVLAHKETKWNGRAALLNKMLEGKKHSELLDELKKISKRGEVLDNDCLNVLDQCFLNSKMFTIEVIPFLTSPVVILFIPVDDLEELKRIEARLKEVSRRLQVPVINYTYSRILDILSLASYDHSLEQGNYDGLVASYCMALSDVLLPQRVQIELGGQMLGEFLSDVGGGFIEKSAIPGLMVPKEDRPLRLEIDLTPIGNDDTGYSQRVQVELVPVSRMHRLCTDAFVITAAEVESVQGYLGQLFELIYDRWEHAKKQKVYAETSRLHLISEDIKKLIELDDERRSIYLRIKEAMGWATEDFLDYFVDLKPLFYSGRRVPFPAHDGEPSKESLTTCHNEKNFNENNWVDYSRYLMAFNEGKNNAFILDLISVPAKRLDDSPFIPKVLFGFLKLMIQRSHVGGPMLHPFQLLFAVYVAKKKANIAARIVHIANDPIKCQLSEASMTFQVLLDSKRSLTEAIIASTVTPEGISGLDVCNQWLSSAEKKLPVSSLPPGFCAANVMGAIIRLIRFELQDDAGVSFERSVLKKEVGSLELQLICNGLFTENVQMQLSSIHNEAFADERGLRSCIKTLCESVNRLCPTISDHFPEEGADCPGFVIVGEKENNRTTILLRWRD